MPVISEIVPVVDINYTEVVVTDPMQGIASSDEILMGSAPSLSVNSSEAEVQAVTLSVAAAQDLDLSEERYGHLSKLM